MSIYCVGKLIIFLTEQLDINLLCRKILLIEFRLSPSSALPKLGYEQE